LLIDRRCVGIQTSTDSGFVLELALGTTDAEFISGMLGQLGHATTRKGQDVNEDGLNFVLSVLAGVSPKDRVEAMLAAQMAVVQARQRCEWLGG